MKDLDLLDIAIHLAVSLGIAAVLLAVWVVLRQHWLVTLVTVMMAATVAGWFWKREGDQYEAKYGHRPGWMRWSLQKKLEAVLPAVVMGVFLPLAMVVVAWWKS